MISLDQLKMSDILPDSIKSPEILAIASALDNELQKITASINEITIMPFIDEQPEDVVDLLAWQLHVDFYEPLGLDLNLKRTLVKNSLLWHSHKGTKYALVEIIRVLFLADFDIEEWFEYGGQPYFFRLIARDNVQTLEKYNDLIRAIFELKNERSWLDCIRVERKAQGTIYIGNSSKHSRKYIIDGIGSTLEIKPSTLYAGTVSRHTKKYIINGTEPILNINPGTLYTGSANKHSRKYTIDVCKPTLKSASSTLYIGSVGKHSRKYTIKAL